MGRFAISQAALTGREAVFVLHAHHSVCIAPATQPVTIVELADVVLGEVSGLAA